MECHSVRHGGGDAARANGGKQRSRSQQLQEGSPVVQAVLMRKFGYHICRCPIRSLGDERWVARIAGDHSSNLAAKTVF